MFRVEHFHSDLERFMFFEWALPVVWSQSFYHLSMSF